MHAQSLPLAPAFVHCTMMHQLKDRHKWLHNSNNTALGQIGSGENTAGHVNALLADQELRTVVLQL